MVVAVPACVAVAAGPAPGRGSGRNGSDTERLLCEVADNHQSRQVIRLKQPVTTDVLELRLVAPTANVPAALFEVRCFAND